MRTLAGFAAVLVGGCGPATPTTPAASLTGGVATAPPATATGPPTGFRPVGDLTITLVGGCTWHVDPAGGLWLRSTLQAFWTGPTAFPANGFRMTANYGAKTASGSVTSSAPFASAIGGEPATGNDFLGHAVRLTIKIDPTNVVAETVETNNVTFIEVVVPEGGYGTAEKALACSIM